MNEPVLNSDDLYPTGLFEVTGIELEYMIVDSETLNVLPICDQILSEISGFIENEVHPEGDEGFAAWSNELALHVIEFKSLKPIINLEETGVLFQQQVNAANAILSKHNAILLPSAMHPWMNPDRDFRIWPHDHREIYDTFDRIFKCRGHGWSNLQSIHINLPFRNNDEFVRLHSAIRVLLPVMNALTASSPYIEGKYSGYYDTRLEVYRTNSGMIPSITGLIIPEPVKNIEEYNTKVLNRIYTDLEKYDTDKIISYEWVNARGCIPRFSRGTIEIRTNDIQECPSADIACARLIIDTLQRLTNEEFSSLREQLNADTGFLHEILISVIKNGGDTFLENVDYLKLFGIKKSCSAMQFWEKMAERFSATESESGTLENIFAHGNLSERLIRASGNSPSQEKLLETYAKLSFCLDSGIQFIP